LQIKTKIVSCHTADSKPVKQEVNGTVIFPPLVFLGLGATLGVTKFSTIRATSFVTLKSDLGVQQTGLRTMVVIQSRKLRKYLPVSFYKTHDLFVQLQPY
jgi:hypothetical protein